MNTLMIQRERGEMIQNNILTPPSQQQQQQSSKNQQKQQPQNNNNGKNQIENKMQEQKVQNKPTKLKKVGDYIFIKQIGSGAYSTVHQGRMNQSLTKVAIKMIPYNKLNETVYNRVISEIKILRSLNHKNIVKIMDFKKTTQNYYLIFEYCQNGDLESYIKKHYNGKMSEILCQQVMFQVRDAFKELTHHKIVHRDLKLANILVDESFTIKIADFGFAKHNQDDDLLKSTLGTPITMAPEILDGKKYNEKCDIWSLGVIIYQMLFGKPPFMPQKGGGIPGLIKEIQKEVFTFPEDENFPVSNQIKNLLNCMLVVNPQKRIDYKDLFLNKWITGEFRPDQKENLEYSNYSEIDLTQSLKMKKQLSKEKQQTIPSIQSQQAQQIQPQQQQQQQQQQQKQQKIILFHPKEIAEDDENLEEEEEEVDLDQEDNDDDEQKESNKNNNNNQEQQQVNEKEDDEDVELQTTYETNLNLDTPTPSSNHLQMEQSPSFTPLNNQINPQIQSINESQKENVVKAGLMKLALQLRKYYEKRIIVFIANCKKFLDFYEKCEQSEQYQQNQFYRYSVFLNAIIITSRISDFIQGNISIKIDSETFSLGSYQTFSGLFLEKGDHDPNNYIHILKRKLGIFQKIVCQLKSTAQMSISKYNSPEFLFLQNIIQAYSLLKLNSDNKGCQDIVRLIELFEKLQMPTLSLQSTIRKQGIDIKKLLSEVENIFNIIKDVIQNDKKYVKYQNYPFEIKISYHDIPQNEQQFIEIKKKLLLLFNHNDNNNNNKSYDSNFITSLSSVNTVNQLS